MLIYLCASGDFSMLGCFMKYCLRVSPLVGLKGFFPGFFKVDASGFFEVFVKIRQQKKYSTFQ